MFAQVRDVIIQNAGTPLWRDLLVLATPLVALLAMWRSNVKAAERQQEAFQEERSRWDERLRFDRDQALLDIRTRAAAEYLEHFDEVVKHLGRLADPDDEVRDKSVHVLMLEFIEASRVVQRLEVVVPDPVLRHCSDGLVFLMSDFDPGVARAGAESEAEVYRLSIALKKRRRALGTMLRDYLTMGTLPPAPPSMTSSPTDAPPEGPAPS